MSKPDELAPIDSVNKILKAANWNERELQCMYGVYFKILKTMQRNYVQAH